MAHNLVEKAIQKIIKNLFLQTEYTYIDINNKYKTNDVTLIHI